LRKWLGALSPDYFIAGDNAYPLLSTVLIPFNGANVRDEINDAYNFYLSQLRIRIDDIWATYLQVENFQIRSLGF